MHRERTVGVIIPALNEEATIGRVIGEMDADLVDRIVVVDNGSSDDTAGAAARAGATVVTERRRGYGAACARGVAENRADIAVFVNADGSDDPREIARLLDRMREAGADLVIGSRTLGRVEQGALTPVQRGGNALACALIGAFWGRRYTDLGPLRAVTREALDAMSMTDRGFGWTVEMQVKALRLGLAVAEVPVSYRRRRGGRSKISGSVRGTLRAGTAILGRIAQEKLEDLLTFEARS